MADTAWDTSSIPGIAGALTPQSERDYAAEMPAMASRTFGMEGAPIPASQPTQAPLEAALGSLGQWQATQLAQQGQQQPPFQSLTMKADGTFKMEGSQSMLADVMGQLKDLQTMKTAAMARVAQLRQQEASGSPLLDALSQFAGGMAANDPTMPGWVRALGATSLRMGPQGIKAERQMEEQKALQYGQAAASTAEKLMEFQQATQQRQIAEADRQAQLKIAQQNADTALAGQKGLAADRDADNFRQELAPVMAEVKATGRFNADMEQGMRQMAATHPNIPAPVVEAQIRIAKGAADAAALEIQRKAQQTQANLLQKAAIDAQRQAQMEGRQINVAVVKGQLSQADKMATQARLDVKTDAPRLQSLNEMAIVNQRMRERLESDPFWQGPLTGPIAEKTYLTTSQQAMIADQAKAFIAKMGIAGLSFAKTSDAEMKKILASVVNNKMTVAMAKKTIDIIDAEGQRAASQIARDKWASSPEDLAARLPSLYRDAAMKAFNEEQARLTPQQRLARGLATGDADLVQSEMERVTGGLRGRTPAPQAPTNSTRPGEIRMAAPAKKYPWEK